MPTATVLREGKPVQINANTLVPGDVVTLEAGNMVPAHIRLLKTHSLHIEEASLTGESNAVEKQTAGLEGEPAEKNVMELPPRKPDENIFAHGMGVHILWVGLLIGAVCLSVQAWALNNNDPKWQTYVFTILCFSQMGHVMAIRSEHFFLFRHGIFTNLPLIGAILLTFVLQLGLLYVPFLQKIFSTQALTLLELGTCILISLIVFHAVEMEKMIRKWRGKKRTWH
ncbi:MAG: cation-translocating P-type ATPase [Saprospiraceae bacterium]|nr:cation-translocating P-type ATPase [Saprospiraceae bacterium]